MQRYIPAQIADICTGSLKRIEATIGKRRVSLNPYLFLPKTLPFVPFLPVKNLERVKRNGCLLY